jgi:hypothetical protein
MKYRFYLILMTVMALISAAFLYHYLNKPIKDKDFIQMSIYLTSDQEVPYVISDKKVINEVIKKINSSPKEDISKIIFEHGPDGRIIFKGNTTIYEVKVFSYGGNVVTEKYYIHSNLFNDLIEIFGQL